jgi:hypothetical protein
MASHISKLLGIVFYFFSRSKMVSTYIESCLSRHPVLLELWLSTGVEKTTYNKLVFHALEEPLRLETDAYVICLNPKRFFLICIP